MRYSCADFTFPLLSHDKVLALLRLLEFDAVDLGVFEGRSHLYPSTILSDISGHADRLRRGLERNQLDISDVFLQTGAEPSEAAANDPDPAVRESNRTVYRGILDFARRLGCKHLTGLPGVRHAGVDPNQDWELGVNEAAWRVKAARDEGITYAVEPHVGSLLPDPESTLRFLKAVFGLTLTLDYGHFIYQGMENHAVHPLLPHASHFHARCGAKGRLQATAAENVINFSEIARRMRAIGYDAYLCIEYVWVDWEGCNRTDNISETLLLRKLLEDAIGRSYHEQSAE